MNYTIRHADLELARPSDIVSGWASALQDPPQVVRLFRARNARQHPRGNALVTYTFTVSRQHASLAESETYLADLPRLVRNANRVAVAARNFTRTSVLGSPEVRLEQAHAVFQAPPLVGLRTTVTWTITGVLPDDIA